MKSARPWLPWVILGALLIASSAVVFWAGRDTVFRGDDWDLLLYRGGFNWDVFLVPHGEHLSALLVLAYKVVPAIAGPHYGALRLLLIATVAATVSVYFVFARQRVGDRLALLTLVPLLLMGAGSDNLLWPTQIGVVASLACGIGALLALDREGTAAKALACILLVVSIFSGSYGLFFLLAASIWLGLTPSRWRDLWLVAIPAVAYIAWYEHYGSSTFSAANLRATPQFVAESAAAGVGALTGLRALDNLSLWAEHRAAIGALGALVLVLGFGAYLYLAKPRLGPRSIAILSLPIASWIVVALGRAAGGDAFATRYAYPSALFILMALVELVRGDAVRRFSRGWLLLALGLAVVLSVVLNTKLLVNEGDYWREVSQAVRGRTAAIELARATIDPNLPLEPLQDMAHMTPGWYLNAVERFGSSPTGGTDPAALDAVGKTAADQVLVAGEVRFAHSGAALGLTAEPPSPESASQPYAVRRSCLAVAGAPSVTTVAVPRHGMLILPHRRGGVTVSLRGFSTDFAGQSERVLRGPALLTPALDSSPARWHARVDSEVPVSLCGATSPRRLLQPSRPASGNQHCVPMSIDEPTCRFRR